MPFDKLVGSRAEVFHGTAKKTAYGKKGLTKSQLKKNPKTGKIVSKKASSTAKRKGTLKRWMNKEGLCVRKGAFGLQKKGKTSKRKRSKGKGTRKRKRSKRCRHKKGPKRGKYRSCYSYNR